MKSFMIAVEASKPVPVTAISAAWVRTENTPNFDYRDLDRLSHFLIASTVVKNVDLTTAVNAAVQRTVEKMYIRDIIPTTNLAKLNVDILLKPRFRKLGIRGSVQIVRSHWLVTSARELLKHETRRQDG